MEYKCELFKVESRSQLGSKVHVVKRGLNGVRAFVWHVH